MESILTSIKKMLGPTAAQEYFDPDIIMHINTALFELNQLGVGPAEGFRIEDESTTWEDYIPDTDEIKFEAVKTLIYLKVKLVFDPPASSTILESMKHSIDRLEWRLNAAAEEKDS